MRDHNDKKTARLHVGRSVFDFNIWESTIGYINLMAKQ